MSYDAELIWNAALALHEQEARWDATLQRFEAAQLSLRYEDLAANYDSAVARVFHFLGIEEARMGLRTIPRLQRQSDRLTEDWARRASVDLGARLNRLPRVVDVK